MEHDHTGTTAGPWLYVHIGIPKTGTTALQRQVFPKLAGFDLAMKPRSDLFRREGTVDPGLFRLVFNRCPEVWRHRGAEILRDVRPDAVPARPLLVSEEGMSSGKSPHHLAAHFALMAPAAREAGYTGVRAILSIRRQDQWLGSYYAQKSDRREDASQEDFERFVDERLDPAQGRYEGESMMLDYAAMLEAISETLGKANVLPLVYEDMERHPAQFAQTLCSYLDAADAGQSIVATLAQGRENARSGGDDTWQLRPPARPAGTLAARFARKLERKLADPGTITMTGELRKRILEAYEASNRRFAEISGRDLARHGYF
ncbi:sulfotransferase domain-containing protein [Aurantiacibacter poecillastricola]|uniref:sulfotransferase domain-containing protein n=1 Tax=Aurantiacibacter poecillastricola TaxID=3064385 RepID=UPI00273F67B9|nr:sulfotransferase domain-containing protein [Aurantiacibacter sp. 219JJ12-13]MDP5263243.1 sulfotransferase domain-containing protein [Aurantiacibacter sp. 219JJ12-13]